MAAPSEKRVVMARAVARRWLEARTVPQYRVKVYTTGSVRNLPSFLRSFRDGKVKIKGVPPIKDLGIRTGFDFVDVWSRDREAMIQLNLWFESQGMETTGIW